MAKVWERGAVLKDVEDVEDGELDHLGLMVLQRLDFEIHVAVLMVMR